MARGPKIPEEGADEVGSISDLTYIRARLERERSAGFSGGGGGGGEDTDKMEVRVAHLETRMGHVEDKLDRIFDRLGSIATRSDMRGYVFTAIGVMVAIVAILVASMGWLEDRTARIQPPPAAATQPIVIQLPVSPTNTAH